MLIEDVSNERLFSIASIWEMAIKASTGRLGFASPFDIFVTEQMQRNGIDLLSIDIEHAAHVIHLPYHHIAQSFVEQVPIISIDTVFDYYSVTRLW